MLGEHRGENNGTLVCEIVVRVLPELSPALREVHELSHTFRSGHGIQGSCRPFPPIVGGGVGGHVATELQGLRHLIRRHRQRSGRCWHQRIA